MTRLRAVWIGAFLVLLGGGPAAAQGEGEALVTATNVQLMAGPSFSAEAVLALPQGTRLRVLEAEGEWVRVLHRQHQGFVHAALVSVLGAGETGGATGGADAAGEAATDAADAAPVDAAAPNLSYEGMGASLASYPDGGGWSIGFRGTGRLASSRLGFDFATEIGNASFQGIGVFVLQQYIGPLYALSTTGAQPFVGGGWAPSYAYTADNAVASFKTFYLKGGAMFDLPDSPFAFPTEVGLLFGPGGSTPFFRTGITFVRSRTCDWVVLGGTLCLK